MQKNFPHRPLAWLFLSGLVLLAACLLLPDYGSFLVLVDAGAGEAPSRLKQITATPTHTSVAYTVAGRSHTADLYLPGAGAAQAAIVLVPGATPDGKDDARLVAFAHTLARARFTVLAPELKGLRELRLHTGEAREVADALAYLASRPHLAPAGRAGIAAFSYALGPAVLAALEEDVRSKARFILGVGGYYDLPRTVGFFTTGCFEQGGRWNYLEPDEYGKLVFARSSQPYLPAGDREIVDAMVAIRYKDRAADISRLAPGLGPEGRTVYALLANTDPARVPQLLAALPVRLRADIAALSLHNKDLTRLRAHLILVHGKSDNLVAYSESIALAAAVPPGQARLFVIHRILGHVDLGFSQWLSWKFLTQELPDIWRMWRAMDALLAERETADRQ